MFMPEAAGGPLGAPVEGMSVHPYIVELSLSAQKFSPYSHLCGTTRNDENNFLNLLQKIFI